MKLDKKKTVGLVAVLVLTVVGYLFGADAVKLVRDAVDTAPVTTEVAPEPAPAPAPVTTESDTAPVDSRE